MRDALCAAASALVEARGIGRLTTRNVAVAGGASLASIDELFGGKAGLVRAVVSSAFGRLAAQLTELPAPHAEDDPVESMLAVAAVIRAFVREHPRVSEVMFAQPFAEFAPTEDDTAAAQVIYDAFVARAALLLGTPRPRGSAKDAAIALSAVVQGLVALEHARTLGSDRRASDRRWDLTITATVLGLRRLSEGANDDHG